MSDDKYSVDIIVFLIAIFISSSIGILLGMELNASKFEKLAIEKGHGQYNSVNGEFEWKG